MVALDQKIETAIDRHFEACKVLADYITDNPELGMEENKAVAAYKTLLENAGML
ncbi:MAG: hypothetical protein Pg6C_01490 [Treponemataceae bacterium]|nr:MAG: hypothetical protein Pg6C_01490 [Treponemataceae bacterium]